jgi:uncharacterized lipoprotein YmbA
MPTRRSAVVLAALAGALCSSCGTTGAPLRYYTLAPLPPDSRATVTPSGPPLRVERVTIPAELNRLGLVWRVEPNRLEIAENARWAAPLDEMIRRTLSANLTARLPAGSVVDPREPVTSEARTLLYVAISSLDVDARCAVTLEANWTLEAPGSAARRASESVAAEPVAPCPDGMGAGLSHALADLSGRVAGALTR